jgi:hypothetical protein
MSVAVEVCSESTIGVNRIDEFSEVVHSYLSIKSIPEVQDRCTKIYQISDLHNLGT